MVVSGADSLIAPCREQHDGIEVVSSNGDVVTPRSHHSVTTPPTVSDAATSAEVSSRRRSPSHCRARARKTTEVEPLVAGMAIEPAYEIEPHS